jgi:hypothetical protein
MQPAQQLGDGGKRRVGLTPRRIWRHGNVAVDEDKTLASVLVQAHR